MTTQLDELVDTLLWEGHQLYPYTPSATKNATPTPFGIVYPPAYAAGSPHTLRPRQAAVHRDGDGGVRRDGALPRVRRGAARRASRAGRAGRVLLRGRAGRASLRRRGLRRAAARHGRRREHDARRRDGLTRNEALELSLLSTHVVVRCATGGRFMSPIAPPEHAATAVMTCANVNIFPVLATPADDAILGAAIMLPDHPEIAPESRGSLFDSTEIEEALLLHVLALSDGEREELQHADPAVKAMIERAVERDAAGHHRPARPDDHQRSAHRRTARTRRPRRGDDRRRRPHVLARRPRRPAPRPQPPRAGPPARRAAARRSSASTSTTTTQVHLCVTVDDDPGQDIMRDIGRYLYFKPTEVEVIGP